MDIRLDLWDYESLLIAALFGGPVLVVIGVVLIDLLAPDSKAGYGVQAEWAEYWNWPSKFDSLALKFAAALFLVAALPIMLLVAWCVGAGWLLTNVLMFGGIIGGLAYLIAEFGAGWWGVLEVPDWAVLSLAGLAYALVIVAWSYAGWSRLHEDGKRIDQANWYASREGQG